MNEVFANAHPFTVHFAVALVILSATFELLAVLFPKQQHLKSTGLSLGIAAVPFLLFAVFTGNLAEGYLVERLKTQALSNHTTYANVTVWTFTALMFWRIWLEVKKSFSQRVRLLYIILIAAIAALTFLTAQQGGMIFHHSLS